MVETISMSVEAPDLERGLDFAEAVSDLCDRHSAEFFVELVDMSFRHGGRDDPATVSFGVRGERDNALSFLRLIAEPQEGSP